MKVVIVMMMGRGTGIGAHWDRHTHRGYHRMGKSGVEEWGREGELG